MQRQNINKVINSIRDLMYIAHAEHKKIDYTKLNSYLLEEESVAMSKIRNCYEKLKPLSNELERLTGHKMDVL